MIKIDIIKKVQNKIIEKGISFELNEKHMDTIALDLSRVMDKECTNIINSLKSKIGIKINNLEKEKIRKYLIGYPIDIEYSLEDIYLVVNEGYIEKAYSLIYEGFKRKEKTMIDSIVARVQKNFVIRNNDVENKYLEYISSIQKDKCQLLIININAKDNFSEDDIAGIINDKYESLSNYHNAIIIFNDDDNNIIGWEIICRISIFMEQFKQEYGFNLFNKNKDKKVKDFLDFLSGNENITISDEIISHVTSYYSYISYGFQFQDLFISNDGKTKVLVMQKVELDESAKKCPSCLQDMVRGNSYPRLLYKSFECQNPSCPSRSKIGRGKRYDLFSAKRQVMLHRNSNLDRITDTTYANFRRDIFNDRANLLENMILLYTWAGDNVQVINGCIESDIYEGRSIHNISLYESRKIGVSELEIYKLFDSLVRNIKYKKSSCVNKFIKINDSIIINGDSSELLYSAMEINKIFRLDGAVTSPPYYNAREYSKWDNLLFYLVDMMINAYVIYDNLEDKGVYIYNIGDIVGQDNIYINSNMSNRRQMLGFFSMFIFERVGYKIIGNIIWDKGEVQSKRNSSPNRISGYIKPVNSYEHCIVFQKKGDSNKLKTVVKRIDPVKKINSKGENILGHTAPYPVDIPKLLIPFLKKGGTVLDPFLGSGTTIIALRQFNVIGFELNKDYYSLALERSSLE